jgi:hypothetical protein
LLTKHTHQHLFNAESPFAQPGAALIHERSQTARSCRLRKHSQGRSSETSTRRAQV